MEEKLKTFAKRSNKQLKRGERFTYNLCKLGSNLVPLVDELRTFNSQELTYQQSSSHRLLE